MGMVKCHSGVRSGLDLTPKCYCGVRPRGGQTPSQAGFTLTELLISLVLGAFVVGGVLSVFLGGLQTFRMTDSLSRMQESGRFALELMRRDLREAGFVGCRNTLRQEMPRSDGALDPGMIRNTLNPAPSGSADPLPFEFDFGVPLMGYDGTGDGEGSAWTAGDPLAPSPASISTLVNPRDDSDIVVMIAARGSGLLVSAHPGGDPPGSAALLLNSTSDIVVGDIVFATDCASGAIFEVTGPNGGDQTLVHNTGNTSGTPGNYTTALGRSFVGAEVFRIERAAYYVGNGPNGRPVLYRNDEEIAENVEQLQVSYGLDTTFDAQVNQYLTATEMLNTGSPWDNVIAVRMNLLLSSGEEDNLTEEPVRLTYNNAEFTAPAGDRRLYRVFTATVGIRNRVP